MPGRSLRLTGLALVLALAVAHLLFAPARAGVYSDSELLMGQAATTAAPYYNFAYVPLGHLAVRIGAWTGWGGVEASLIAYGRLATLLGGLGTFVWLRVLGVQRVGAAGAVGVVLASPLMVFFNALVEVHGVAFCGAAWGLVMAQRAGAARGARAWGWWTGAALVAVAAHLSHVFLVPALVGIAWARRGAGGSAGDGAGLRLVGRWRVAVAGVALALAAAGAFLLTLDRKLWAQVPGVAALGMLAAYVRGYVGAIANRGLFGWGETGRYLAEEWLLPFGLLVGGAVALVPAVRRRAGAEARRSWSIAGAVFVLTIGVMSQGGILERGGYGAGWLPVAGLGLALGVGALGERWRAPVWSVLIVAQLGWARWQLAEFVAAEPDARIYAAAVAPRLRPGDQLFVSSLALEAGVRRRAREAVALDLVRKFETVPLGFAERELRRFLRERWRHPRFAGRLLIERRMLEPGAAGEHWSRALPGALAEVGLVAREVPGEAHFLELVPADGARALGSSDD